MNLPRRISCDKCHDWRELIDFKRIDLTNPIMSESMFRYAFVTPFQALIEVNLMRVYAFQYDHAKRCGKRATFTIEEAA